MMLQPNNHYNQIINSVNQAWPYLQAKQYKSFSSILATFPHLKSANLQNSFENKKTVIGVIIRSANDDNVHKAIKYGIWTTTPKNKVKLDQLWQKCVNNQAQVYLFFSVVKSGMFEGVARLVSGYNEETFPFWWQNHSMKFKGFFCIEWTYIKDINYKHFNGLYSIEGEEVTKSKDCDVIQCQTAIKMLQIYNDRPMKRYIFDDFQKMDDRQKNYTRKMYEHVLQQQHQQHQQQYYNSFDYRAMMPGNMGQMAQQLGQVAQNKNIPNGGFNVHQPVMNNVNHSYNGNSEKPGMNGDNGYQHIHGNVPPIKPHPKQMMVPNYLDPKGGSSLGFQMNPVSKNRKK